VLRRLAVPAVLCCALAFVASAAASGVDFRMYGPSWDVAALSTPTWSFDCHWRDGNSWSTGFIVRRDLGGGSESWGYSYDDKGEPPSPFTWSGFPYNASGNPGHISTGYIIVTNWSVQSNRYTNIARCEKPRGKAIDAAAAAAGTVTGKEQNGGMFAYSTRVVTEREPGGTRHLFVTRPLRANGTTDARLSCSRGMRIVRAFSHVGYYTSRPRNDRGEARQWSTESRATVDERVTLRDIPGETDVVGLARQGRAIVYQDIYCARS
jgi:hypothetical protein